VSSAAADRVRRVVGRVCAAAVRDAGASGVVVLDDWTPEGELVCEWLLEALDGSRVWRAAAAGGNVPQPDARLAPDAAVQWQARQVAQERGALVAHPANRTALLLGGRVPAADLLPLGDVWASHIEVLTGSWSAPEPVTALAAAVGGVDELDRALGLVLAQGPDPAVAVAELGQSAGTRLIELYEAGRYYRLRPRLVPKLEARTLGIDLFD
jgi:hypothetical protein